MCEIGSYLFSPGRGRLGLIEPVVAWVDIFGGLVCRLVSWLDVGSGVMLSFWRQHRAGHQG